ncbi:DUF1674 domain-containing protein [Henriciella sp. AS95]|uniref:DUF1674 domain-containing protein n=1 Tax=Henriciella sp. AS95 TaxID=3135782 RepID=UPI00316D1C02
MTKPLSPEAQRALEEARARRDQQLEHEKALESERAKESGGPKNREPTRFGDWERKGITYDF